jgi:hypothetical protein
LNLAAALFWLYLAAAKTATATLMWSWTPAAGSPAVTGFRLQRITIAGAYSTIGADPMPVSARSFLDTNVTCGKSYYYRLYALSGTASVQSNYVVCAIPNKAKMVECRVTQ